MGYRESTFFQCLLSIPGIVLVYTLQRHGTHLERKHRVHPPPPAPPLSAWNPVGNKGTRVVGSPGRALLGRLHGRGQHAGPGCLSGVIRGHSLWGLLSLPCGSVCSWLALPPGAGWRWERLGLWVNGVGGNGAYELGPTGLRKVFFVLGGFFCGEIYKT